MPTYIYQYKSWPQFTWDEKSIQTNYGEVKWMQGRLAGQMDSIGFKTQEELALGTLTDDIIKTSEIEGERLPYDQVRSSVARRLGIETGGLVASNRSIEGVVEMMLDATKAYTKPLSDQRLFGWHAALFPTGYSGPYPIEVGRYRTKPMQVVSGAMGKEKIHYEAIEPGLLELEMKQFLEWFNHEESLDPILKAAIAHFWFIIIHPFDDGNGRIGRAISDLLLARAEKNGARYYSLSSQIMLDRKNYYAILQKVQHNDGDITEWLDWFLSCLKKAMQKTESEISQSLYKSKFWTSNEHIQMNERQRIMLNKLLDGFKGRLQTSKWAKITKVSSDTALRDIHDLVAKGILKESNTGGRSTYYELVDLVQFQR